MGRRTLHAVLVLSLLAVTAGVAGAPGGGGGAGGGGGGGGRRRSVKGSKGASQVAALLDSAIRHDNVRRARYLDW